MILLKPNFSVLILAQNLQWPPFQSESQRTYKGLWDLIWFREPLRFLWFSCLLSPELLSCCYSLDTQDMVQLQGLSRASSSTGMLCLRYLSFHNTFSVSFSLTTLSKITISFPQTSSNTPYLTLLYVFSTALITVALFIIWLSQPYERGATEEIILSLLFSAASPEPRTVSAV